VLFWFPALNLSSHTTILLYFRKASPIHQTGGLWREVLEELERLRLHQINYSLRYFLHDIRTTFLTSKTIIYDYKSSSSSSYQLPIMIARVNVVFLICYLTSVMAFQPGALPSANVASSKTVSELYAWTLPIDTKAAFGTWYTELHPTFRETTYEE
jgi:hypothetical protein